jgi:hypothetical protein
VPLLTAERVHLNGFDPGPSRARAAARMHARLADSLQCICDEARGHILIAAGSDESLARLRERPVSPALFSAYYDLALARSNALDEAERVFAEIADNVMRLRDPWFANLPSPQTT